MKRSHVKISVLIAFARVHGVETLGVMATAENESVDG